MATKKKTAAPSKAVAAEVQADPEADRAEAAGRAQDIADDISGKAPAPDKAAKDLTSKTYTALHAIVRGDQAVAPGDKVKFTADEGAHVQDLLDAGVIADADHADDKLAASDAARAADAARR